MHVSEVYLLPYSAVQLYCRLALAFLVCIIAKRDGEHQPESGMTPLARQVELVAGIGLNYTVLLGEASSNGLVRREAARL